MEDSRDTIISFRNAEIANGENTVIYGLDMDVRKGDFVYIIGRVGSGKTSIIRTITAENPLYSGEGTVCGYDLRRIKEKEIQLNLSFNEAELLTEILLKQGFMLTYKLELQPQFTDNNVYWATDGEREAYITVDTLLAGKTVDYFLTHTDKKFICIERALDTTKKFNLKKAMGMRLFAF